MALSGICFSHLRPLLAGLALLLLSSLLSAPPAHALPGGQILGHRCKTWPPTQVSETNENTVVALEDTAGVAGAACEIDVWRISDGTLIVWHDSTWGRVADHSTLPAGVSPSDPVRQATWQQVSQIRTKGGAPVPTLRRMIERAAALGVPLVVEIRNVIPDPAAVVGWASTANATVSYYKLPTGTNCDAPILVKMYAAGARIGWKMPGPRSLCKPTAQMMRNRSVTFNSQSLEVSTKAYLDEMNAHGIETYVRGAGRYSAPEVLANGAARVLVNEPRLAAKW